MRGVILDAATLGDAELDAIVNSGDQWQVYEQTESSEISARIENADIVLTNKVVLDYQTIATNPELKLIVVTATGTNNIDLTSAEVHNKIVCNVRGYGSASVAQHTLGLMLNLATQMPQYLADVRAGEWQRRAQVTLLHRPIFELSGKRLGIVGFGQLGRAVANLAEAFGMEVCLAESRHSQSQNERYQRMPLPALMSSVDFVSLHCPLTEQNHQLINADSLKNMSPSSFLINTSRGGLVDSQALLSAIQTGQIAGAAVDVLPEEPPPSADILIDAQAELPNLLITPHNAWGAKESRQRLVQQVSDIISAFHQGKPFNRVV